MYHDSFNCFLRITQQLSLGIAVKRSPLSLLPFMKYYNYILLFFISGKLAAQNLEVTVLSTDQLPLSQAHIVYFNGYDTTYSITNNDGAVLLDPLKAEHGWINASYITFQEKVVNIRYQDLKITIVLQPHNNELDPVIVTGLATEKLASQAVVNVTVINRDRIDKQAATNLRELLTNDLNFNISEDPVLGSQLKLGGLDGQKIKILIDGVPVIGRVNGNIDLSQINLNNIERVEIIQGPMSVQYGTDAIAGTINLITKKKLSTKLSSNINAYYESVGRYNFDAALNIPVKKFDLHLNLGRYFFDGFDLSNSRDLQWNPKEQYFTQFALKHRFKKSLLSYNLNFFNEKISNKGAVGSIDSLIIPISDTIGAYKYPRALDDYYHTMRLDNSIRYQYFIAPKKAFKIHLAYNHYRRIKKSEIINLTTLNTSVFGGLDAQDTTIFQTLNSRAFYNNYWIKNKLDYQLGYELTYDKNQGQRIEGGLKDLTDLAVFATLNYKPVSNFAIEPGLRLIYNSGFNSPLVYSLSTKYSINKKWDLRASYGKGFRAPTLKELYFFFVDENHNILGNEKLKAEFSHNFQFNSKYRNKRKDWSYEANLNLFFNDIKNEIRLIPVVSPGANNRRGIFTNVNIDKSQTTGTSFSFKSVYKKFKKELGISIIGTKNYLSFSEAARNEGLNDFLFYPQFRANLSYELGKSTTLSYFLNATGARKTLDYDLDGNLRVIELQNFAISDLSLIKSFSSNTFTISTGVKNLFNVINIASNIASGSGAHNSGTGSFPINYGRNFFIRVQLQL